MNKKIQEEQAKREAEEKKRAEEEAAAKAAAEAAAKQREEEIKATQEATGFKLKSANSTTTNTKQGKLSKGAKKLGGGGKRIKF